MYSQEEIDEQYAEASVRMIGVARQRFKRGIYRIVATPT
jgi:hypothetical protein